MSTHHKRRKRRHKNEVPVNIKKASSISTITYEDCRAYIANEIFPKPQSTTNDQPEKVGLEIEMLPIVTDSREAPTRTARHDQTSAVISELARDHHWEILSAPTQDGKAEVLTLVRIQGEPPSHLSLVVKWNTPRRPARRSVTCSPRLMICKI